MPTSLGGRRGFGTVAFVSLIPPRSLHGQFRVRRMGLEGRRRRERSDRKAGSRSRREGEWEAAGRRRRAGSRERGGKSGALSLSLSLPAMGREQTRGYCTPFPSRLRTAACLPACRATRMAAAPPSHTGLNTLASSPAQSLVTLAANAEVDDGLMVLACVQRGKSILFWI